MMMMMMIVKKKQFSLLSIRSPAFLLVSKLAIFLSIVLCVFAFFRLHSQSPQFRKHYSSTSTFQVVTQFNGQPKISFLFLARKDLPLDFLWNNFLQNADLASFSIYIHSEPGFVFNELTTKSSFFYGRQLSESVRVVWGESSMIEAERLLLGEALQDPANQRFVLLSDRRWEIKSTSNKRRPFIISKALGQEGVQTHRRKPTIDHLLQWLLQLLSSPAVRLQFLMSSHLDRSCVPLYNFSYIYNYLMSSPRSFVDSFLDAKDVRYHPKMSPVIPKGRWRKGSQWIAIVRKHAEVIVDDDVILPVFKRYCKRRPPIDPRGGRKNIQLQKQHNCIPDEHYVQTLLSMNEIENELERRTLTYTLWNQSTGKPEKSAWHPVTFTYAKAGPQQIKEIKEINHVYYETEYRTEWCKTNSTSVPCFLFARKFSSGAAMRILGEGVMDASDVAALVDTHL